MKEQALVVVNVAISMLKELHVQNHSYQERDIAETEIKVNTVTLIITS